MALTHDDELGLLIDDEGNVYDEDTREPLGTIEEWYDDLDDDEGLSDDEVAAIYAAGAEDRQSMLDEVNARIASLEGGDAERRGYELAHHEAALYGEHLAEVQHAFDEAMIDLATRMGRPIAAAEAAKIHDLLPNTFDDRDVDRVTKSLGIASFNAPGKEVA
jgi:hypothetical protein